MQHQIGWSDRSGREIKVTVVECENCTTGWRVDWWQMPGYRDKDDVACPNCGHHLGRFENESIRLYRGEEITIPEDAV